MKSLLRTFLLFFALFSIFSCDKEDPIVITVSDLTVSIDENPSSGQVIGTIVASVNKGTVSFTITSQNVAGAMNVDASSGELTVADASVFDFEVNPTITASVNVSSGGKTEVADITVNLNNVADAIAATDETLSIDENPNAGQNVTTVMATVDSGTPSFNISSQTPAGAFALDASSGVLTVADHTLFDFETNPTLTVVVTATNSAVSDNATITVNLNNVLEVVTTQDETVTIDENPTNGQTIVTVVGTTDLGSVSFNLVNESVQGAFDLNVTSGELTVADASLFDYEANTSLTATINVVNTTITETAIVTVNLNDVFELIWTQVNANVAFGGIYGHQIVEFNGKLWSIGGIRGTTRINEVWSSTDGNTWTQVNTGGNIFSARNAHQVVVFNNKMWVIGGFGPNARTNDIWSSSDGSTWTQVNTSALFTARSDHAAVVFNNKIWVIGGSDGSMSNEVWSSSDGANWTKETTSSNIFTPRMAHRVVNFNGTLVLAAGADLDSDQLLRHRNDIWTSTDGITWTEANVTGNLFVERWIHGMIVHDDHIWVLGGDDNSGNRFNDVWTSPDGLTWTQQTANPVFDVRDQMAVFVFDGKLWVSGGSNNNGILTDMWRSN